VTALRLRIGSRPSALALAQAGLIKARLEAAVDGLAAEIVAISTSGDKLTTASLAQIGGKGLFIRELEQALADGRIDLAVHSMKDLPAILPAGYRIAAVPAREDPRDALLTRATGGWRELERGARLGTSSTRRRMQAVRWRPDLAIEPLRGNVDTRIARLVAGDYDAIILALAGLRRLGKIDELARHGITIEPLDEREFIPSGGQGALAIEAIASAAPAANGPDGRTSVGAIGGSRAIDAAVAALNDPRAMAEVAAERAMLATIGASCVSPVGVRASADGATITIRTILFSADGGRSLTEELTAACVLDRTGAPGTSDEAAAIGVALGERMLARGARDLIGEAT